MRTSTSATAERYTDHDDPKSVERDPLASSAVGDTASGKQLSHEAVAQARREIQSLVREIADLARQDIAPQRFYEHMLSRVVAALAARGGAVWVRQGDSELKLAYQINLDQTGLTDTAEFQQQHARLLNQVVKSGESTLVPPGSSSGDDETGNPSPCLLIIGAMQNDQGVQGVVEIFQRADTSASTQRGYLRFLQQICELAGDFLKSQRLRHLNDRQELWEHLDRFAETIHRHLDLRDTAYAVANEGRRVIGCDRVTVLLRRGGKLSVSAISGQDDFERRSTMVRSLEKLARVSSKVGEPLCYEGDTTSLAPQVEDALQKYLEQAHCRMLAVLPLTRHTPEHEKPDRSTRVPRREQVGALIVENLEDATCDSGLKQRIETVARHSGSAIANAQQYNSLFLLPLWRLLGRASWLLSPRGLPKTLLAVGLLVAAVCALVMVPADFKLQARGTLQPSIQQDVFASMGGVVLEVPVDHADFVDEGQRVAKLRNTDLEIQITDVLKRREAASKQLDSIRRALLGENRLSFEEQNRLAGEALQLQKTMESLDEQLELYRHKQEQLEVLSPIAGEVTTWQVKQRLARRTVREGQVLLTVADPTGPWHLEIHMPEDRMGHVAQTIRESEEPVTVEYILATNPGKEHVGYIEKVHARAEVHEKEGNAVLIRVAIDKEDLGHLRPGASVIAKVDCGRRSVGYVWLHDLIHFVQSRVLFHL